MKKQSEFEKFDEVMSGLLAVPRSELQRNSPRKNGQKGKKKKRPISTASRVSASGKRRGT
jgi:hypothetical protein